MLDYTVFWVYQLLYKQIKIADYDTYRFIKFNMYKENVC